MAKNIYSDFLLTVEEKISLKSIAWICEKSCATSLALYWAMVPSEWYLALKTHLDPTAFQLSGSWLYS